MNSIGVYDQVNSKLCSRQRKPFMSYLEDKNLVPGRCPSLSSRLPVALPSSTTPALSSVPLPSSALTLWRDATINESHKLLRQCVVAKKNVGGVRSTGGAILSSTSAMPGY